MAEPHLDHPGETTWFAGYGPAPVIGPCPHVDCEHHGVRDIAWGPSYDQYALVACDDQCDGQCRGWFGEHPTGGPGPRYQPPRAWQQVDLERQVVGATWL